MKKKLGLSFRNNKGFTLLEILLVVAAIAILAGIVILAINPGKQLGDTRDAQRRVDVNTILNAIYQYAIDNGGAFPGDLDGSNNCISGNTCVSGAIAIPEGTAPTLPLVIDPSDLSVDSGDVGAAVEILKYDGTCDASGTGLVDICTDLTEDGVYLAGIPNDPSLNTTVDPHGTGYWIYKTSSGRITVIAPFAEQAASGISVTR